MKADLLEKLTFRFRIRLWIRRKQQKLRAWLIWTLPGGDDGDGGIRLIPVPRDAIRIPEPTRLHAVNYLNRNTHDFFGEDLIRETLVNMMQEDLKAAMDYREVWDEAKQQYRCSGEIAVMNKEEI